MSKSKPPNLGMLPICGVLSRLLGPALLPPVGGCCGGVGEVGFDPLWCVKSFDEPSLDDSLICSIVPEVFGLSVSLLTVVPSIETPLGSPLSIDGFGAGEVGVLSTSGLTFEDPGRGISRESSSMAKKCCPGPESADISTASCCIAGSSAIGIPTLEDPLNPFSGAYSSSLPDFFLPLVTAPAPLSEPEPLGELGPLVEPGLFLSPASTSSCPMLRLASASFFWFRLRIKMKPAIAMITTSATAPIAPPIIAPFELEPPSDEGAEVSEDCDLVVVVPPVPAGFELVAEVDEDPGADEETAAFTISNVPEDLYSVGSDEVTRKI